MSSLYFLGYINSFVDWGVKVLLRLDVNMYINNYKFS